MQSVISLMSDLIRSDLTSSISDTIWFNLISTIWYHQYQIQFDRIWNHQHQIQSDLIWYHWYHIRSDQNWYHYFRSDLIGSDIDNFRYDIVGSNTDDITYDMIWAITTPDMSKRSVLIDMVLHNFSNATSEPVAVQTLWRLQFSCQADAYSALRAAQNIRLTNARTTTDDRLVRGGQPTPSAALNKTDRWWWWRRWREGNRDGSAPASPPSWRSSWGMRHANLHVSI